LPIRILLVGLAVLWFLPSDTAGPEQIGNCNRKLEMLSATHAKWNSDFNSHARRFQI